MQICNDRNACNALPHDRHFQSCFGICNAANRISRWICDGDVLASMHYTADCNLSCVAPKTSGLVLLSSQLDYGVGTFLHMIRSDKHHHSRILRYFRAFKSCKYGTARFSRRLVGTVKSAALRGRTKLRFDPSREAIGAVWRTGAAGEAG